MMEFGKSLKAAREAKGLTVAQVAEMTHLAPTTVNELESEDFSRIAAPIYGRGFVKLYCEAVGLDPKPFVAEFMEIFSGNHDTGIKERPVVPAVPEEPPIHDEPEPVSVEDPPASDETIPNRSLTTDEALPVAGSIPPVIEQPLAPASRQRDLFSYEPEPPPVPAPSPVTIPTAAETPFPGECVDSLTDNNHSFSRYAEPLRQLKPLVRSPLWRIAVLAGAALALLILLVIGIRAIYRATSVPSDSPTEQTVAAAPTEVQPAPATKKNTAPAKKAPKPAAKSPSPEKKVPAPKPSSRTPQKIPSLYID